jgi:hypothetical protein
MHGTITVESRPGGGSIFIVVLPVEDIELPPAGMPQKMRRTLVSAESIPTTNFASTSDSDNAKAASPQHTPLQCLATSNDNTTGKMDEAEDKAQHLTILVVDDSLCFVACPLYPC